MVEMKHLTETHAHNVFSLGSMMLRLPAPPAAEPDGFSDQQFMEMHGTPRAVMFRVNGVPTQLYTTHSGVAVYDSNSDNDEFAWRSTTPEMDLKWNEKSFKNRTRARYMAWKMRSDAKARSATKAWKKRSVAAANKMRRSVFTASLLHAQLNPYEFARAEVMKRNLEKMKELGVGSWNLAFVSL
jgi:hypothetical protein